MRIEKKLLEILACPIDKGELIYQTDEFFYNPRLRKKYLFEDKIPVLLAEKAIDVSETEHNFILKNLK